MLIRLLPNTLFLAETGDKIVYDPGSAPEKAVLYLPHGQVVQREAAGIAWEALLRHAEPEPETVAPPVEPPGRVIRVPAIGQRMVCDGEREGIVRGISLGFPSHDVILDIRLDDKPGWPIGVGGWSRARVQPIGPDPKFVEIAIRDAPPADPEPDGSADRADIAWPEPRIVPASEVCWLVAMTADELDAAIEAGRFPLPDGYVSLRPYWDRATIARWIARGARGEKP